MSTRMVSATWLAALAALTLAGCGQPARPSGADVQQEFDVNGAFSSDAVGADVSDVADDGSPGDTFGHATEDTQNDDISGADTGPVEADSGAASDADGGPEADLGPAILGPLQTLTLSPHDRPLVDPERGWIESINLLDDEVPALRAYRNDGRTLAWAGVNIGEFREAPISDEFLRRLSSGLLNVRDAGLKVVLRFRYDATEAGIDAPLEQVLMHISQLAPVLEAHSDVVFVLEAGFIGAWGEWHSSSNALDTPEPRRAILEALLAALPTDRSVSVRTPMFKQEIFAGPLLPTDAFDGSPLARVGHHNDCFLASDSDSGTYASPVSEWMNYVADESAHVPVGGETCSANPPRSECASALAELELFRFSYLSSSWHPNVLAGWQNGGCYEEISRRLGHRLQVERYSLNEWAAPGATATLNVSIRNVGFGPLRNPRWVTVWLVDHGNTLRTFVADLDPRTWGPGVTTNLEFEIDLPSSGGTREYAVLLGLPDASEILSGVPEFALQFANEQMRPEFGAIELGKILVGGDAARPGVEFAARGRQLP